MDQPPKHTYRDPADLKLHPLLKNFLPETAKDTPQWNSFVDNLSAAGPDGIPPLFTTKEGLVMAGGRRLRGAKQLQWDRIPCIERPDSEAAAIIVESAFGQRNIHRSALVYFNLKLLGEYVTSAETRRRANLNRRWKSLQTPIDDSPANLKNLQKTLISPNSVNCSSEDRDLQTQAIADRWGVEVRVVWQASRLLRLFNEHPEFREEAEFGMANEEKSVWNIESAIKGALADQGERETSKNSSQLELFTDGLSSIATSGRYWSRFDADKKEKALAAWRDTVEELPADLRDKMVEILEEAGK